MKIFQKPELLIVFQKRFRNVSAFCVLGCLFGCTDIESDNQSELNLKNDLSVSASQQSNILPTNSSDQDSLLTLKELLNATDVKLALAKAADEQNMPILEYWQQELLKAAAEVNLSKDELQLISGPQGLKYLEFQGLKTNYQNAFEQAFIHFQDIDAVYDAYPTFENLHERSRELVLQRDKLILQAAQELKAAGFEGDALQEARQQWQNYITSQTRQNQ